MAKKFNIDVSNLMNSSEEKKEKTELQDYLSSRFFGGDAPKKEAPKKEKELPADSFEGAVFKGSKKKCRLNLVLTEEQSKILKDLSKTYNCSMSSLVGQMLEYLASTN